MHLVGNRRLNGLQGRGAGFYPAFVITATGSVTELILVRGQLFSFKSTPQCYMFLGIVYNQGTKV